MKPQTRDCVFISYSHRDVSALARLQVHLRPFERAGKVKRWDDTRIRAGQYWGREVREALASTRVAVLLVSADFLASDFIIEQELPELAAASRRGDVVLLPVLLKPCAFHHEPALSGIQFANSLEKPLVAMSDVEQEALWSRIAEIISSYLPGVTPDARAVESDGPQLGRTIWRRCDRLVQEREFKRLFDLHLLRGDERLQFYVLHGDLGECHDSLVMRFQAHIEARAPEIRDANRAAVKTVRCIWPFGPQRDRVRHLLSAAADELRLTPGACDADAFSGAFRGTLFPFIVLHHDLLVERWDRWTLGAIQEYADFLRRATRYSTGAEIVVFLNIIYPPSKMPSWLRWFSPKARVAAALERLSASGVTVFPELEPVTRVDLIEWFKQHMRCDEATVMAKCAEFLKGASRRRMADIEPLLAATFEKYAYEHG